jgi:8-oxo-dGTP pyrophosphatase MutT (NUDIX family)
MINSKDQILVASRDSVIWELPGGGCDEKSSTEACVLEIYEECGLKSEVDYFFGFFEYLIKKDDIIARNIILYCKCNIIGSQEIDLNWKDLGYDVIKYRKFIDYKDFIKLNGRKSLNPIQNLSFDEIKNGRNFCFEFYDFTR